MKELKATILKKIKEVEDGVVIPDNQVDYPPEQSKILTRPNSALETNQPAAVGGSKWCLRFGARNLKYKVADPIEDKSKAKKLEYRYTEHYH
jgi:hypothetical protein